MKNRPSRIGDGILLIDKPEGLSSARAVSMAKRALGGPKIGHLGTLDPFASGLLPMCVGEATKAAPYLNLADKGYQGVVRLGVESDTLDITGEIKPGPGPLPDLDESRLEALAAGFLGEIEQEPPAYSAIKSGGVPLYKLARRGEPVRPQPRPVTIHALALQRVAEDRLGLEIWCSKGTYVRSLARDLGRALGCGGLLESLRRTRFDPFRLSDAAPLEALSQAGTAAELGGALISPADALAGLPAFEVDAGTAAELRSGRQSRLCRLPSPKQVGPRDRARVLAGGELVAVLAPTAAGWKLERIFAPAPA